MKYSYDFIRADDVEYSGQYMEQIQTQICKNHHFI